MNTTNPIIHKAKLNDSLPINILTKVQRIMPTSNINKIVLSLLKSILVNAPIKAKMPNKRELIRNAYIIDVISNATNTQEKVNPVKNEYKINDILAVVSLIL